MNSLFLTFDVEDFISENSVPALHHILELLKKYDISALFFITGSIAEKLSNFSKTIELLNDHQIGYHSSGHSIHPTIFEFTDVPRFEEAYQVSLAREGSHINPLTGNMEGSGGIYALKRLFTTKRIVAFRAPGYCWSPPHIEALRTLGITYDFSTKISTCPLNYNNMTFYPFPFFCYGWNGGIRDHSGLQKYVLTHEVSVITIHPSTMVNRLDWDSIYYHRYKGLNLNPEHLIQPPARSPAEIASIFHKFELLLRHLETLQKIRLLKVTPELKVANKTVASGSIKASKCYKMSIIWATGFGYEPKFLYNHFKNFFDKDYPILSSTTNLSNSRN